VAPTLPRVASPSLSSWLLRFFGVASWPQASCLTPGGLSEPPYFYTSDSSGSPVILLKSWKLRYLKNAYICVLRGHVGSQLQPGVRQVFRFHGFFPVVWEDFTSLEMLHDRTYRKTPEIKLTLFQTTFEVFWKSKCEWPQILFIWGCSRQYCSGPASLMGQPWSLVVPSATNTLILFFSELELCKKLSFFLLVFFYSDKKTSTFFKGIAGTKKNLKSG